MKNATAIKMPDQSPKREIKSLRDKLPSSPATDIMDVELNRFLRGFARSREFNGRQLLLPGFCFKLDITG